MPPVAGCNTWPRTGTYRGVVTTDQDSFGELVREHQARVRNYVARRVPPNDVDDVVAEVFGTAWRHRDRLPEQVDLWLLRTAWNAILHQYRRALRQTRLTARLASLRPDTSTAGLEQGHDPDAAEAIRSALATLSASDQELLRLTYWEQLSSDEVAYVVGCSVPAARVRLHRARRRLQAALPPWLAPPRAPLSPAPAEMAPLRPTPSTRTN